MYVTIFPFPRSSDFIVLPEENRKMQTRIHEKDKKSEKLKESIDVVIAPWKDSPYYKDAEELLHIFWQEGAVPTIKAAGIYTLLITGSTVAN